ncbi:MAG: septum formation initiator family protein [Eubacteriales bacterium]|nr:septum formation initiator family protein [Eubacteriales bacterium]
MRKDKDKKAKRFIVMVIAVLTIAFFFQLKNVFHKYNQKQDEIEVLQQKIVEENEKNLKLKEYEKYMKSDAYIEDKAREEFNLIKDGEEVYILKKE